MRHLDYPPVWLIGCLLLARAQAALWTPGSGAPWAFWAGGALVLAGLGLMLAAVPQFLRRGTTVVPHRPPSALVTGGIYRISRNPIYLGDVLLLAGFVLIWGAWPSLVLVPLLAFVLQRRFILPEEARLQAAFGDDFRAYRARVRRWL